MFLLIMIVLSIIGAIVVPKMIPSTLTINKGYQQEETISLSWVRWMSSAVCVVIATLCFLGTSCVIIDSDKVGHLKRIYGGDQMPAGRIIANWNEKGPQARVLTSGFQLIPFIRVTHDIDELPIVVVPEGKYGFLVAKDGVPMPQGQFIAPEFKNASNMIDAEKFMGYVKSDDIPGTKGPQLTVLPPGSYRINRYLFDITSGPSTKVPTGFVAVIKSNVGDDYNGPALLPTGIKTSDLSVPLVPKGYRGVWNTVITPGEYYINSKAYDVTLVDTRVQTWKYLGGYTRKWAELTVGDDGKIAQKMFEDEIKMPDDAADCAAVLRIQGWDVFLDSRVQVQVTPQNAPFVVASVGGVKEVENKIITPNYRSILRNVISKRVEVEVPVLDSKGKQKIVDGKPVTKIVERPREVLDLLYQRAELEKAVAKDLVPAGAQAGLTVQWVRFGDPAVPPALLIPGKRSQLAQSLMNTYRQEKSAQTERVETEKERARANEQENLMKSQIGITVANNNADAREKEGLGEEKYMKAVARGQLAQANVLGKDKAFELAYVKEILAAAKEKPEMIKYPGTLVMGSGSSLEGAAAILGKNNLTMGLTRSQAAK